MQRDVGFNGGIQTGTTAFDNESLELDKYVRKASIDLEKEFGGLERISRMNEENKMLLVGDDCFGFSPDGGAWFKNGNMVAVFEAKKQNKDGNAYERWWDNAVTAKYINKDVIYVTFCSGKGAAPGECLDKLRRKATIMMGNNYIFHMSETGFEYIAVKNKIKEVLINI